jgi:O-antigen/teichoic acid export membrane protein
LIAVISLVVYWNIGSWFAIQPELIGSAQMLVLLVGLCFVLAMPLDLASAVLSGLQRYDLINLAMLVILVLRTALLVVLLLHGYGLLTLGLVCGVSEVAVRVIYSICVFRLLPKGFLSRCDVDFRLLREMLGYGVNTFLYTTGALIIYKASTIIIGIFIGPEQITQFYTAAAGVLLLAQFIQTFTAAIKPAISDLDARNDHKRVKELSFLTQKYSLLLIIPGACFLVIMGREFLQIWVGAKFQDPRLISSMAVILAILTVGHCIRLAQHSNFLVLVGRGEHKVFGILTALTAILCVAGSVVSVRTANWGLVGIAWSNLIPMALISGVFLPIYFNWKMKVSMQEVITRVWRPAVLGCLPSVVLIGIWKYAAPPESWAEIIAVVLSVIVVTITGGWFLSLERIERQRFASILTRSK